MSVSIESGAATPRTGHSSGDRVRLGHLLAFAAPCLPLAAFGLPLTITLPHFYSESLGLNVGAVGLAFVLVRLIDIGFDPVFGTILDRTRWSFGRFRGWMAISAPILMLAIGMLFLARPGVDEGYLWFWLLTVYFGFSIAVLTHTSWASKLSPDYHERSRVFAYWQTGNVVGMIIILALPVLLNAVGLASAESEVIRFQGWLIVIALPLMIALNIFLVPEPKIVEHASGETATLKDYFRLIQRPTVIRILIADLLTGLGPGVAGTLFFFFFIRIKQFTFIESSALLLIYFLAATLGSVIWARLAGKVGKARALMAASLLYAAVQIGIVFLPAGNFLLATPFLIAAGLPYSAGALLLRSMMADYGDEERLASGKDRTGLLYAVLTGTVKIGAALAATSLILLNGLGFDAADAANSTAVSMQGLSLLYAAVPGLIGVLAACAMIGYPLTEARHAEIRQALDARDRAEAAN